VLNYYHALRRQKVKKRLWLTALIPLLVITLLFTGCPRATTGTTTTLEDVKDEVDALGDAVSGMQGDIGAMQDDIADLQDASSLDLSDYATGADLSNAFSSASNIDKILANLTDAQIATLKTKLGLSSSTTASATGKVTAEIIDADCDFEGTSLDNIHSDGNARYYAFTVKVTNGTDDTKWIYCSPILNREEASPATAEIVVSDTELTSDLAYYGAITYTTEASPDPSSTSTGTTMVTFAPTGGYGYYGTTGRFAVKKGDVAEIQFLLKIKLDGGYASWSGSLLWNAKS
jgi:hypothetical protein